MDIPNRDGPPLPFPTKFTSIDHPHSWCNILDYNGRLVTTLHVNDFWEGFFWIITKEDSILVVVHKRISGADFQSVGYFLESYEFVRDLVKNWTGNDLDAIRWGLTGTPIAVPEGKTPDKTKIAMGEGLFGFTQWTNVWEHFAEEFKRAYEVAGESKN